MPGAVQSNELAEREEHCSLGAGEAALTQGCENGLLGSNCCLSATWGELLRPPVLRVLLETDFSLPWGDCGNADASRVPL